MPTSGEGGKTQVMRRHRDGLAHYRPVCEVPRRGIPPGVGRRGSTCGDTRRLPGACMPGGQGSYPPMPRCPARAGQAGGRAAPKSRDHPDQGGQAIPVPETQAGHGSAPASYQGNPCIQQGASRHTVCDEGPCCTQDRRELEP